MMLGAHTREMMDRCGTLFGFVELVESNTAVRTMQLEFRALCELQHRLVFINLTKSKMV